MAEAASESPEKEESGEARPRVRPPDRRKFEEEQEQLSQAIQAKHVELKSVHLRPEDVMQGELRGMRKEKETTIQRRKEIDRQLSDIMNEVKKKMDSLSKVQGNLPYKNEDRINEAIRRLEHQLKTQNFNLREEKKIVAEIDRLKRSKKSLVHYTEIKRDVDAMRDRARRMREERDRLYKAVTVLKGREEEMKRKNQSGRERADDIKREIEELEEQKRRSFHEFKKQEREYNNIKYEIMKKRNEEFRKKMEEERLANIEAQQKELAEIEAMREPYEDEKQLCLTLVTYLQRYLNDDSTRYSMEDSQDSSESTSESQPQIDGMYMLQKKKEELFVGMGRQKPGKRDKRGKRKVVNKPERPIVHNPEIFAQFASLSLEAPSTMMEIPASISVLQEKKKYFDSLPRPTIKPSIHIDGSSSGGEGSAGAPSFTESAISESIPSTPEVMLDSQGPRLLRDDAKDSGMELDENNSSDELTPTEDSCVTSQRSANPNAAVIPMNSYPDSYLPLHIEDNMSPSNIGHFPALPKLTIPHTMCGEAVLAAKISCDDSTCKPTDPNSNLTETRTNCSLANTAANQQWDLKSHDQQQQKFKPDGTNAVTDSSSDNMQNYLDVDQNHELLIKAGSDC